MYLVILLWILSPLVLIPCLISARNNADYLIISGSILIGIASVNEYNKRKGKEFGKPELFRDWTY
ncbi:MAG: hypothetical protein K6F84_02930 [Lachnospiraceae bacterium]|nr:hypothetical protein [Lachnospiraceae bacterium]